MFIMMIEHHQYIPNGCDDFSLHQYSSGFSRN